MNVDGCERGSLGRLLWFLGTRKRCEEPRASLEARTDAITRGLTTCLKIRWGDTEGCRKVSRGTAGAGTEFNRRKNRVKH